MGAWRGSVFTSGHVLSLELAQSPVRAVNVNEVQRDAISCNRNTRVKLFKEFNGCSSTGIWFCLRNHLVAQSQTSQMMRHRHVDIHLHNQLTLLAQTVKTKQVLFLFFLCVCVTPLPHSNLRPTYSRSYLLLKQWGDFIYSNRRRIK